MHFSAQDCLCQLRFSSPRRFLSHVVHITWKDFCHSCNQMKNTLIQLTEKPVLLIQFLHPKASPFVTITTPESQSFCYNYCIWKPVILLQLLHLKASHFVTICGQAEKFKISIYTFWYPKIIYYAPDNRQVRQHAKTKLTVRPKNNPGPRVKRVAEIIRPVVCKSDKDC